MNDLAFKRYGGVVCCIFGMLALVSAQKLSLQTGHSEEISVLQFSPDGKFLASGSEDNTIVLWDNSSGKQFVILSGHTDKINDLAFHPSLPLLASASDDQTVRVWEYPSGNLLKTHAFFQKGVKSVDFSYSGDTLACGSDFVYLLDRNKGTYDRYGSAANDSYHSLAFSPYGKFLAYGGEREPRTYLTRTDRSDAIRTFRVKAYDLDFSEDGQFLFAAGKSGQLSRYEVEKFNPFSRYHIGANSFFNSYQSVTTNDDYFIGANNDKLIYVFDKNNGKKKFILKGHLQKISTLAISADGQFLASAGEDRNIILWNLKYGTFSKVLKGIGTRINTIAFSNDGNELFIGYNDGLFRLWNLREEGGIISNTAPSFNFYKGTNDWQYSITDCNDGFREKIFMKASLNLRNKETKRELTQRDDLIVWAPHAPEGATSYERYKNSKSSRQSSFALTETSINRFRFSATYPQRKSLFNSFKFRSPPSNVLHVDFTRNELDEDPALLKRKKKIRVKGDVIHQSVSQSGTYLAALIFERQGQNHCDVLDGETGAVLFSFPIEDAADRVGFSPDERLLYVQSNALQFTDFWDLAAHRKQFTTSAVGPIGFSAQTQTIAFANAERALVLIDGNTGNERFRTATGHTAPISDIQFNDRHGFLGTASYDGFIRFWDVNDGSLKVSLAAFNDHDFIFIDPDNYYHASLGAIGNVAFTIDDRLYAFEQFDMVYNRPDKVMARLGFTSKSLLDTYHLAYKKRLKLLGMKEEDLGLAHHIPELSIDMGTEFQIETTERQLIVNYTASDSLNPLIRVNVWLNDVPYYGRNGLNIQGMNTGYYQDSVQLSLSPGLNKVQISCINEDGAESIKETFEISYKRKGKEKPDLYLVALGVSHYQDTTKNLHYAAKDARDLATLYGRKTDVYHHITIDSLFDEEVTTENLLAIKPHLMQSDIDDEVILFFAGHGVLSKAYDYYLGTYDMDFNRPETGLLYETFISLIDSIPARKKLVLMDACHSGEIDKEEVKLAEQSSMRQGKKRFRTSGGISIASANNTFEVLKSVFPDFRRGSGAHIISSAGATEYAQESDEWENGIFTLCLMEGLKDAKADQNKDGEVDVGEIQDYLRTNVYERTEGQQLPTSRAVNYANNYTIWKEKKLNLWSKLFN